MPSEFQINTLGEIAVLKVAVERILTHLAKSSADPRSFLANELAQGLESLATLTYWTVSHKNQKKNLARREFPGQQGVAREPPRRRRRPLGGREPERAQGRLRRSADGALAESGDRAQRDHAGAGQGHARRARPPRRRRQLQHRAARSGDPALPGAAGGVAGRVSSLSRPEPADRRGAGARHGV